MKSNPLRFYIGTLLNPKSDEECVFLPRGVLVVSGKPGEAKIDAILSEASARKRYAGTIRPSNTTDFGNALIVPGFFDLHFHWVQDEVRTLPKDSLLQWLEKYTFPAEARFVDPAYAKAKAKPFFKRLLQAGTVGGAVYSSIHECALRSAMSEARGDFVIGNVLMNMNSPSALTQTEKESLGLTRKFIQKYGQRFAFTPRFAITTPPQVMKEGARMADQAGCFKQTHLSENLDEIQFTLSLFKKFAGLEGVKNYTEVYQKSGMLGPKSLMAHGIHLSEAEWKILSKTRTSIVHCPTSNAPIEEQGLGSGLFDFKKAQRAKVRWALGSDIGGGPILSMLDVMRSFVQQNRKSGQRGASYVQALYRATGAGASILGVGDRAGNFRKGKDASFVVLEIPSLKGIQSAEQALAAVIEPLSKKRDAYDLLPRAVSLRGRLSWNRP